MTVPHIDHEETMLKVSAARKKLDLRVMKANRILKRRQEEAEKAYLLAYQKAHEDFCYALERIGLPA